MGDINGDGRKDLAVTGGVEEDGSGGFVEIYTQAAGGNFTLSQSLTLAGCNMQALLGDFGGPSTTSGRLDLAVVTYSGVNTDKISIFPNNGAGGFALPPASQYMTGPNAGHQVTGDFNSDGKPDIAVSNGAGKVPLPPSTLTILLGKGGAQFEAAPWYAENAGTHFPALGELNNDGKADAATACITGTSVSIRLGNGDGTFGGSTTIPFGSLQPNTVTIGDLNGDSFADLAVSFNGNQSQMALCENNGNGTFKAPVYITLEGGNADTNQVVAGDLTGDGKRDLIIINRLSSKVYVLINQCAIGGSLAAGSFTQNSLSPYLLGNNSNPRGVALGDMNGDGCVDIVTANAESEGGSTGTISILLNHNNDGTFTSNGKATTGTTNGRPFQVALVDVDSDGKLDALVANRQDKSQGLAVLTGKGDGTFNSAVNYPTLEYACGITAADFNGDGKIDVATSNTYGTTDESENGKTLSLFLNKGNGTFNAPVNYFVGTAPRNLNSALLNNDPRPDIVTADYSSNSLSVLLHQ
jgi:hypothetical protein